ncbi:MAG: S8 family serine peptidase [Caldilineales bacterium]|nr:S8 family serine peptidase [Caldilineales bacterium]MCW5859841.1 S8 family serine peptidase [Caldilineales bacterium]
MTNSTPPLTSPPAGRREGGCAWALVIGLLLWSLSVTLAAQGGSLMAAWFAQMSATGRSLQQILAAGLLQPLLVGAPALLLLAVRGPRQGAVVRTILLATLAASLLLTPRVLLAPDQTYAAGLARAGIGAGLGLILLVWARAQGRLQMRPGAGLGLMALLAVVFLVPWLLFGALGDGLDVLLAMAQAAGLALMAASLAALLMPQLAATSDQVVSNHWLGGVALAVALAAIGGAWGQMDYQAFLLGLLPVLAFPLAWLGADRRRFPLSGALLLVFVAACGPFAFADPRETHLIGLYSGDTVVWTLRALGWDLLLGLAILLILGLAGGWLRSVRGRAWVSLAMVGWVGAAILYLFTGQPGFYGDDFFVVMNEQADLSGAAGITAVDARRTWVYETLVTQADAAQLDLLTWLDKAGISYTRYYLVDGIEVHANALRRWQISRRPDVARVLYSPSLRPLPEPPPFEPGDPNPPATTPWGVEAIGAPRVWEEFGVTGEGVVVGQSDSGVDAEHPALAGNFRGRGGAYDFNWLDPWTGSPQPYDANGHGTHTLGTVLGQGGIGVAPGAVWFGCANLVRNLGNIANYLDCMQFMLAPHPQQGDPLHEGDPTLAADVSTNSWGCPADVEGCDQETLWLATAALRAAGIFFVAAAGNEGPACNSLRTPPGNYGNVLSVGAIDRAGDLATFSNRGPATAAPDGSTGPDLLAPGVGVTSAWPGGTWKTIEGTSMAAPHVAGVVALMWSANPALAGNIDATERILQETASPYTGPTSPCETDGQAPDSASGFGILDAYAAVERALAFK